MGGDCLDLAWDGETMIYEGRGRLAIGRALREGRAHHDRRRGPANACAPSASVQKIRSRTMRLYFAGDERLSPLGGRITLDPPRTDLGLGEAVSRSLSSRMTPRLGRTATGPNDRPGPAPARDRQRDRHRVSGGLDSTPPRWSWPPARWTCWGDRAHSCLHALPGFRHVRARETNATLLLVLGISRRSTSARRPAEWVRHRAPTARARGHLRRHLRAIQAGLRTGYLFRLANHLGHRAGQATVRAGAGLVRPTVWATR